MAKSKILGRMALTAFAMGIFLVGDAVAFRGKDRLAQGQVLAISI